MYLAVTYTQVFVLVLSTELLSDVIAGQPSEHNEALCTALEPFVTQELNTC